MDNNILIDGISRIEKETISNSEGDIYLEKLMAVHDVIELIVPNLAGRQQDSLKRTLVSVKAAISDYQSKRLNESE